MTEPAARLSRKELWAAIRTERAALVEDLAALDPAQWMTASLCDRWTVEDVVAHLTAAATTGRVRWIRSVLAARFDFDLHNDRGIAEHRGASPAETLDRFRAVVADTTAASGHTPAWLGEVVVHAQDIRRPLGLPRLPGIAALTAVAEFFVGRDFTVPGKTAAAGLRLEATDGPFRHGDGPLVRGTTEALTMALAGRGSCCDDLEGPGVTTLRARAAPTGG